MYTKEDRNDFISTELAIKAEDIYDLYVQANKICGIKKDVRHWSLEWLNLLSKLKPKDRKRKIRELAEEGFQT